MIYSQDVAYELTNLFNYTYRTILAVYSLWLTFCTSLTDNHINFSCNSELCPRQCSCWKNNGTLLVNVLIYLSSCKLNIPVPCYSLTHYFVFSLTISFSHSLTHSLTHSPTPFYSFTHPSPFSHSFIHPIHSLTHPPPPSTHSPTQCHSLTSSPTHLHSLN